jgi:hypothetical protein
VRIEAKGSVPVEEPLEAALPIHLRPEQFHEHLGEDLLHPVIERVSDELDAIGTLHWDRHHHAAGRTHLRPQREELRDQDRAWRTRYGVSACGGAEAATVGIGMSAMFRPQYRWVHRSERKTFCSIGF